VIAAHVAASIDVPSPEPVLIQIEDDFITAAGGELADIAPGLAFGTVWEEDSFPVARAVGALAQVSNPESVAGVTVLDSLIRNTDRHAENALLVALGESGSQFRLVFIDNALSQGVGAGAASGAALTICVPTGELAAIVRRPEEFYPYLLQAEGLNLPGIEAQAISATTYGWGLDGAYPASVCSYLQAATKEIRPVVLSGLSSFPNCR
jgi:hypothetical protein